MIRAMNKKPNDQSSTRSQPVSLAPLSFEDALKALVATPPMTDKSSVPATTRAGTKRKRKKKPA
jgi:hypothetical protein